MASAFIKSGLKGYLAPRSAIKLITFDVTGTILKFRKNPVEQYIEFGSKYGVQVNSDSLKKSFKQQWVQMNSEAPNYGTCWRTWWTQFVVQTFRGAGVTENSVSGDTLVTIANELIEHFSTSECWEMKEGAYELLSKITMLNLNNSDSRKAQHFSSAKQSSPYHKTTNNPMIKISVISNFDPRLRQILIETKCDGFFDFILTSHECQIGKPDSNIFKMALNTANNSDVRNEKLRNKNNGIIQASEALHVGDNYQLDYVGAINSGWKGLLVVPANVDTCQDIPEDILQAQPPIVFPDLHKLKEYLVV